MFALSGVDGLGFGCDVGSQSTKTIAESSILCRLSISFCGWCCDFSAWGKTKLIYFYKWISIRWVDAEKRVKAAAAITKYQIIYHFTSIVWHDSQRKKIRTNQLSIVMGWFFSCDCTFFQYFSRMIYLSINFPSLSLWIHEWVVS